MSSPSYVELKVAGVNLRGRRIDPFAVLCRPLADGIDELARSEVVWGDANPAFVSSFEIPVGDEMPTGEYRIIIYSKSSRNNELRKNTMLGYADFGLERIFAKKDGVIERILRGKSGRSDAKKGSIVICGERVRVPDMKHMFSIQFGFGVNSTAWGQDGGRKAKKLFYVIYRAIINGVTAEDWTPVYRSEIIDAYAMRHQAIMFEGAFIQAEHLYGMDENRGLRFEVFHYSNSGPHIPLGFVQTSAGAFKYAKPGGKLYMVPVPGSGMKSGHVNLEMAKIGLTSRRGGVSSVFCLQGCNFSWGETDDSGDDYLERDAYGRTRIGFLQHTEHMPRGVSYMGSRMNRMDLGSTDDESDAEEEEEKA